MTGTTAKAHLYDLLMEPLKGCKGLNLYRHDLMQRVISMPDLEVRERLDHLRRTNHKKKMSTLPVTTPSFNDQPQPSSGRDDQD